MKSVEILRSKAHHNVLAVSIADVRYGPDAGPWDVINRWSLQEIDSATRPEAKEPRGKEYMSVTYPIESDFPPLSEHHKELMTVPMAPPKQGEGNAWKLHSTHAAGGNQEPRIQAQLVLLVAVWERDR